MRTYQIPSGPLDQTLTRYASEAGIELSADGALTRGKTSPGLTGAYSVQDGFATLLQGQGLRVVRGANGAYTLRPAPTADSPATLPAVTVTGRPETAWIRWTAMWPAAAPPAPRPTAAFSKRRSPSRS
ncbi:STN domain-containing protein [Achromobacter insuavis]